MKKILSAGIILLSATNFVAPAMAQSGEAILLTLNSATPYGQIDNSKNPMNTKLGTVESQYPTSPIYKNSGAILSNSETLNNAQKAYFSSQIGQQAWRNFHCIMLTKGFVWQNPTNIFANNSTCGTNVMGGNLNISNPQLEYQRNLVKEYIARLSGGNVVKTGNNSNAISATIDSKSAEAYKNFVIELTNFEKKITTLDKNNIENYIKGVSEIFAKTYTLEFPNEYRQRHFMEILQKYYAIPGISRQKLEIMATQYDFPILANWINKTKNMPENEIAWVDFGMVHGEYKITAEEKIDSLLYISLYNYQGKKLDKSNLDINATIAPVVNGSLKIEKKNGNGQDFNIIGENISPNLITAATISISQKNNSTFPFTTTFPIKFIKTIEVEEKIISSTDEFVVLPNGFEWKLEKDLIKEKTKVKILAKINGEFINYRVVYSDHPSKEVIPEGKSSSVTLAYPKAENDSGFARNLNEVERYNIVKYFFF